MKPDSFAQFSITTDRERIDTDVIVSYLKRSYWAENRPVDVILRTIEHSLPFGVFHGDKMVGFARVVTDYGSLAYIADVFILEDYRGRGLSKWLMQTMLDHPDLKPMRRWLLATRDAHGLYRQFGFGDLELPSTWMELRPPNGW